MKIERASGVLLHPTSLPGRYGIGDLGPAAYQFIKWLAESGCKLWQILPLGPTGYGDSPYQCFSAFAGNPYLISPDFLLRDDLLHPDDLKEIPDFPDVKVDFGRVISWKLNLLERAFIRFKNSPGDGFNDFDRFCTEQDSWLTEFACFMAIKEANGNRPWTNWPENLRRREREAMAKAGQRHADAVERFKFLQFVFFRQWNALREHAHARGITIIGDIPIFVAHDSADVWANPELFFLDESGNPEVVAGVPPDYFSRTGQLWGNPLYRWDFLKETDYAWWIARLRSTLAQVDIVRLDHFRGFAGYWEIPGDSKTAERGRWVPGPGSEFLQTVKEALGDLPIIAEDLGEITPDVFALRDQFGLPGMKIVQFAFTGPDNVFLPHHYPENCVVYTGTHDNDTTLGWYQSAPESEREFACSYMDVGGEDISWDLIRLAWNSRAAFAITPLQDLLSLGTEARMNYPGTLGGNWDWRMTKGILTEDLNAQLRELNRNSDR